MTYWIKVDGMPLGGVATSAPQWETLADGGCGQADFVVRDARHDAGRQLVPGAVVQIMRGCLPVYAGAVEDYVPATGEVACVGLSALADRFTALDSGGAVTRSTDVATVEAAMRGWPVVNRAGTYGVAAGDATSPQPVSALMDEYANQTAQRWGVEASGRVFIRADPTTPKWTLSPGSVALGGSLEGAVSHYVVRYDTGAGYITVISGHPKAHLMARREETLDLTGRGVLGFMEVSAILGGVHALTPTGMAWSSGATVTAEQLTTIGDTPADLASVVAGDLVRIFAQPTSSSMMPAMWVDVVIGKTRYTAGESTIYLEPVNKAPRTFVDVMAAA